VHWVLRVHCVPRVRGVLGVTCLHLIVFSPAEAQESVATRAATETLQSPASSQEHVHANATGGWRFMDSGILYAQFNHQGSARGDDEFVAPSWWMGMASRNSSHGQLTFASMFSLDPALVGKDGYAELFQVGEALNGQPLIDRQHPHDFFMQLSGTWRIPLSSSTGVTVAGGPVGEPAIGPVAFMHRASAGDNPTATLGHHTLDSTHIAFGVVTAAVDHGPWIFEGSIFNGRESDDNRWNFDFGKLDSYSGRLWFHRRRSGTCKSRRRTSPSQKSLNRATSRELRRPRPGHAFATTTCRHSQSRMAGTTRTMGRTTRSWLRALGVSDRMPYTRDSRSCRSTLPSCSAIRL
jgi:hypothetical protein